MTEIDFVSWKSRRQKQWI